LPERNPSGAYPYLITGRRIGLVHAIRAMVVAEIFVILD